MTKKMTWDDFKQCSNNGFILAKKPTKTLIHNTKSGKYYLRIDSYGNSSNFYEVDDEWIRRHKLTHHVEDFKIWYETFVQNIQW